MSLFVRLSHRIGRYPTPKVPIVEHSLDDLLLLALELDRTYLTDDIDGYLYPKGILLPLGVICELLHIKITVNPEEGAATGYFITENRKFLLDVAQRKVTTVNGRTIALDPAMIEVHRNDIYIDSKLFAEWFPFSLELDARASAVHVKPRELLPIQIFQGLTGATGLSFTERRDPNYKRLPHPYRLWGGPSIDQTFSFSNTAGKTGFRYSSLMTADLLWMNSEIFLSNSENRISPDSRVTFSRYDPYNQLLGRLRASELVIGDTYSPSLPLISTSRPGAGIIVSNYALDRPSRFGAHTFQGNAPPGWGVQLFRDNILLANQPTAPDGRYEFRDIPLLFGLNTFRLLFYGPHGEQREEVQRFNVGYAQTKPGQYFYRFGYNQLDQGGTDLVWQHDLGLRHNLSVAGALASLELRDGSSYRYGAVGLRGFWQSIYGESNFAMNHDGGWGTDLGLQTRVGLMSVALENKWMSNFYSEEFQPTEERLKTRTSLRLDNIPVPRILHLQPMSIALSRDTLDSGLQRLQLSHRLSADVRGLLLSHYLEMASERSPSAYDTSTIRGTLLMNRFLRHINLRGEIYYDIHPDFRLHSLSTSTDFLLPRDYYLSLLAMHSLPDSRSDFMASLSRAVGAYSVGVTANYSSTGKITGGVNVSAGTGREPRTGKWLTDAQPFATRGIASTLVFLDGNHNGEMDPDEIPLHDVGFFINDIDHKLLTNKKGIALLPGLPNSIPTDISVSLATLEDPLWMPVHPGFRFVPRPGHALKINFPIIVTGEITGTVYIRRNDVTSEAAGIPVEAVNAKGEVIPTAADKSAYDGFYNLTKLPTGQYTVRISPEYLERTGLAAEEHQVTIPPEGAYIDGIDFLLAVRDTVIATAPTLSPQMGILPLRPFVPKTDTAALLTSSPQHDPTPAPRPPMQIKPQPEVLMFVRKLAKPSDISPETLLVPASVHFAYDQSTLSPRSKELLDDVVKLLRNYPDIRLHLVGHADIRGSREYNVALSRRRVEAVRSYLVAHGIANSRITVQAVGKDYPVMDGVTPIIHAFNRVVEIFYIAPSMLIETEKSGVDLQVEGTVLPSGERAPQPRSAQPPPQPGGGSGGRSAQPAAKPTRKPQQPSPGDINFDW